MRNVAAWIRGRRASSGAAIQALDEDREVAILFVGSTTEPGPGAALLTTLPDFCCSPFVEDGTSGVDAEPSGRITDAGIGRKE
jgi:hypothetical protein